MKQSSQTSSWNYWRVVRSVCVFPLCLLSLLFCAALAVALGHIKALSVTLGHIKALSVTIGHIKALSVTIGPIEAMLE